MRSHILLEYVRSSGGSSCGGWLVSHPRPGRCEPPRRPDGSGADARRDGAVRRSAGWRRRVVQADAGSGAGRTSIGTMSSSRCSWPVRPGIRVRPATTHTVAEPVKGRNSCACSVTRERAMRETEPSWPLGSAARLRGRSPRRRRLRHITGTICREAGTADPAVGSATSVSGECAGLETSSSERLFRPGRPVSFHFPVPWQTREWKPALNQTGKCDSLEMSRGFPPCSYKVSLTVETPVFSYH